MRVIAGVCRSMPLKTVKGSETRPTTDRIKETLFNMLQPVIPGCRFLDLYAGSGAIGIEALSRGAESCCFVDSARSAIRVIQENLRFTKLGSSAQVIGRDAVSAIRMLNGSESFDIVFMDPPYDQGLEFESLPQLAASSLIGPDTVIILETSLEDKTDHLRDAGFSIQRSKRYKTNQHLFLTKL